MTDPNLHTKRPTRASFNDGRAIHDIYDSQGVKWIAKGQVLSEKQITVALEKGSLTKGSFNAANLTPSRRSVVELKPTFSDITELTGQIERVEQSKNEDLTGTGRLSKKTENAITASTESILDLIKSNQFSPYKLTGLTSFLYHDDRFKTKRPFLKTLNNSGTQHTLFNGIMDENLDSLIVANLLNPFSVMESNLSKNELNTPLTEDAFRQLCTQTSEKLLTAIEHTSLDQSFTRNLIKYYSPHLYFTSPEVRLFQQINQYINFSLPGLLTEEYDFELTNIPALNLANYFKKTEMGGGLGIEGSRIVQYVGLIPSGTAVQFKNREKGLVIAPKSKDTLYCVVITGMDGQPLAHPSLREIKFGGLYKEYNIIPSRDLPLKYDEHSHERIWKMHIVHENLKKIK